MIDLHAHCFIGATDFGPRTDKVMSRTGVTTMVDGGSAGAAPIGAQDPAAQVRSHGHLKHVEAADEPVHGVDDAALVDEDVVDLDGAGP